MSHHAIFKLILCFSSSLWHFPVGYRTLNILAPDKYSSNWILVCMLVGRVLSGMKKHLWAEKWKMFYHCAKPVKVKLVTKRKGFLVQLWKFYFINLQYPTHYVCFPVFQTSAMREWFTHTLGWTWKNWPDL